MSLTDEFAAELAAQPTAEEEKYTPFTEWDGTSGFIQTGGIREDTTPDFTGILKEFGYDPGKVRIVGHPRISRWQQRAACREWSEQHQSYVRNGKFETVWLCAYRFHLAPISTTDTLDLEALVRGAKRAPARSSTADGFWFVFQAGDLQLGKRSRDGSTAEIVDRYVQSVEAAKAELKACKRLGLGGVQVSMPGDCLEGNQSQSGRNLWLTQETITEQTRILRRLMLFTIDELSPLVNKLYLDVVNGNHDEAQRQQSTYPGDGWATEQAIAISDALKLNKSAYGHVEVRVPEKWSGMMTVPVGDTAVCVVHGHQWRPNQAWKWWADQAVNHQPAGGAQVMQNGHHHAWGIEYPVPQGGLGTGRRSEFLNGFSDTVIHGVHSTSTVKATDGHSPTTSSPCNFNACPRRGRLKALTGVGLRVASRYRRIGRCCRKRWVTITRRKWSDLMLCVCGHPGSEHVEEPISVPLPWKPPLYEVHLPQFAKPTVGVLTHEVCHCGCHTFEPYD